MITRKHFDTLNNQQVDQFVLQDEIAVKVLTCGGTLFSIEVPNAAGGKTDVLLGLSSSKDIVSSSSYMGSFIGRSANRIAEGKFTLNGNTYQLAKNEGGKTHLHGGNVGFNQKLLKAHVEGNSLILEGHSPDGEENYPGNLNFSVKYTVEGTMLTIEYFAESDADTIFNPTNHAYFNLNGQENGDISNIVMQIFADTFLPINADMIPTGEERPVKDTVFDFTSPKPIGQDISSDDNQIVLAGGYDHNYCLNGKHAARAYSPKTGIVMDCYTDLSGLQFYTGNFLTGAKGKAVYNKRSGFCLETQTYPNAVNVAHWQSPVLKKGEKFYSVTQYVFGVDKGILQR